MTASHRALSIATYKAKILDAELKLGTSEADNSDLLLQIDLWRGYLWKLENIEAEGDRVPTPAPRKQA